MQAVLYFIRLEIGGEPVELLWERCAVLMAWCSENEACSSILDFMHRLNYRVGSAHDKRIAIV